VLEGLQLSPAGTRLQLNPLYNVERAQKLAGRGKAASGGAQGVDLANLAKGAGDDVKQEKRGDDSSSSDEDEAEEDKNIKVATFGYGDGKMTRCVMLTGVVQTVLLIAFLYLAAALRLNMGDSKRACASLEGAFADRLFVEKRGDGRLEGTIRSFRTINAFGQYTQWLREVVPEVLFGLTAETAASAGAPPTAAQRLDLPAVVEGHTVLLGGLRLLQSRSKTVDRDRCGAAPFVSVNRHRYPHSTFTSMVDPSILTQRIGRDVDPTDLPAVSEALGDAFGAIDFGNVSLCYLQGEVDTAPFGPMAAGASSSSALYARYASHEILHNYRFEPMDATSEGTTVITGKRRTLSAKGGRGGGWQGKTVSRAPRACGLAAARSSLTLPCSLLLFLPCCCCCCCFCCCFT